MFSLKYAQILKGIQMKIKRHLTVDTMLFINFYSAKGS